MTKHIKPFAFTAPAAGIGHSVVLGQTRAGKTTLLAVLESGHPGVTDLIAQAYIGEPLRAMRKRTLKRTSVPYYRQFAKRQ